MAMQSRAQRDHETERMEISLNEVRRSITTYENIIAVEQVRATLRLAEAVEALVDFNYERGF